MKLKDLTPKKMACMEIGCPAIFETDRGSYVLIGKKMPRSDINQTLAKRIAANEQAIEIPIELLNEILKK